VHAILKYAALPVVLGAAALASVLAPRAGAVAPADITGAYAGKLNYRYYPLTEGDTPARGNFPATASATFNPPNLSVTLMVETDEGQEAYTLQGRYGLGRFWANGNGPGGQMALTGKATGLDGKVKLTGKGGLVGPDVLNEISFVIKQQPPL